MKKTVVIPLTLLISGILLGGGGTYFVHLLTSTNGGSDPSQSVPAPRTEGASSSVDTEIDDVQDTRSVNTTDSSSTLEDPSLHKIAFQRKLAVYSYVAGLSEAQITKELESAFDSESTLSPRVLMEMQSALMERLAILNPVAALEFSVESNDDGTDFVIQNLLESPPYSPITSDSEFMPFVQSTFREWALRDVDDAVENAKSLNEDARLNALAGILTTMSGESLTRLRDIAKTLGDEDQGIEAYVTSFRTATVTDPKNLWTEILRLIEPDHRYKMQILENIAEQWYEKDGIRVLDQINNTPLEEYQKRNILSGVLRLAATNNPHEAFQYAQSLPTERGYSSSLNTVVDIWAESDPQAAYQTVTRVEQSRDRERLQAQVIYTWASNEPYYFLENIDQFPSHARETGIESAIGAIAQSSPQEAAELALEQKDEGFMSTLSFMLPNAVIRPWVDQDVEAAVNWVLSGPVPEDKRSMWVRVLVTNLVDSDPRRAFEIALKQPKAEGGLEAFLPALEAEVLDQIVFSDLDLAVELLAKLPEGDSRSEAYASVGNEYIDNGDSERAVNLGLQLPSEEQADYFEGLSFTWARIDPGGLVESIKDLPTPELRSSLAKHLSNRRSNYFTDAQLEELKQYIVDSD
ncbi:MAG: hypothetical protein F4W92_05180 [Gammaproteobacteria bacterium]|nr:hypothetical protein [Gammaproteobacteria bacterium]